MNTETRLLDSLEQLERDQAIASQAVMSAQAAREAAKRAEDLAIEMRARARIHASGIHRELQARNEEARIAWHEAARRYTREPPSETYVRADGRVSIEWNRTQYRWQARILLEEREHRYQIWSEVQAWMHVSPGETHPQTRVRLQNLMNDRNPPGGTWYADWLANYRGQGVI